MFNFARKQQHNQAMNSLNQPVILVVDDIATNVTFMKALLKGKNYEVIDAYSGKEALQLAEERVPDVIILDIMMPVMDGYEVLARLRANEATKHIKVVMLSALSDSKDIKNAMDLGADEYLTKPIFAKKLYQVLDKYTNRVKE